MHKKPGFNLRDICGESVLVAEGKENIDFSNIISMNETAAFLWQSVGQGDFSLDQMVEALLNEYDVDREKAIDDCKRLIDEWSGAGIISL